jgi:hypothetical protein
MLGEMKQISAELAKVNGVFSSCAELAEASGVLNYSTCTMRLSAQKYYWSTCIQTQARCTIKRQLPEAVVIFELLLYIMLF